MPKTKLYDNIQTAVRFLLARLGERRPAVGVVLGTGLGGFANKLRDVLVIPYGLIPGFTATNVDGHAGELHVGWIGDKCVAVLQGRIHYYEGYDLSTVVFPIRVLVALGCQTMIITNAAGGIASSLEVGDLTVVTDHNSRWFPFNPLRGPNDTRVGPRFLGVSAVYDPELATRAGICANGIHLDLKRVRHAIVPGPSFETPAEVRDMRASNVGSVGMSLIPEALTAKHMGAKVVAFGVITDLPPSTVGGKEISHEDVERAAGAAEKKLTRLLLRFIPDLNKPRRRFIGRDTKRRPA